MPATSTRSNVVATVARVVFGLMFFVFGLNGFLNFLPKPATPPPDGALAFIGALAGTHYMFPLIKGTEVIAGALLLANRFPALALTLLAPIVVNIVAFHTLLAPSGVVLALVVLALEIYLAYAYRDAFRPMLAARVAPRPIARAASSERLESEQPA